MITEEGKMADSLSSISIDNLTLAVNSLLNNSQVPLSLHSEPNQFTTNNVTTQSLPVASCVATPPVSAAVGVRPAVTVAGLPSLSNNTGLRLPGIPVMVSVLPSMADLQGAGQQNPDVSRLTPFSGTMAVPDIRVQTPNNILPSSIVSLNSEKSVANGNDSTVLDLATLQSLLCNQLVTNRLGITVDSQLAETQSVSISGPENQSTATQEVASLAQSSLNTASHTDLLQGSMGSAALHNTGSLSALPPNSTANQATYTVPSTNGNPVISENLTNQQVVSAVQTPAVSVSTVTGTGSQSCLPSSSTEQVSGGGEDSVKTGTAQQLALEDSRKQQNFSTFYSNTHFCVQCNQSMKEACLVHNTQYPCVEDSPVLTRARITVPACLYLRQSSLSHFPNYTGVWSKQTIQEHTRFGPLFGVGVPLELGPDGKVAEDFHPFRLIGQYGSLLSVKLEDEDNCNWMIFTRAARNLEEQNVVTCQMAGSVFLITTKEIKPDRELLTWYSADMCQALGLPQDPSVYKLVQCGLCGKQFAGKKVLYNHSKAAHPGQHKHGWSCLICVKSFSSSSRLNSHILGHMGLKPHSCSFCGKQFSDQSNLRTHMAIHTGEKKFPCNQCDKKFRQKAHLETHRLIHTGEKEHKCLYCNKYFARQSDRKIHMYQHTKELSYTCHCGKVFYKTQNYKKHLKVHTGERNFMCSKCFRGFHTKYHRDRHLKICKEKNGKESSYMSLEEVAKLDNTCDVVPLTDKAQEARGEGEAGPSLGDPSVLHNNIFT